MAATRAGSDRGCPCRRWSSPVDECAEDPTLAEVRHRGRDPSHIKSEGTHRRSFLPRPSRTRDVARQWRRGDKAAVSPDQPGAAAMIGAYYLAHIFRIEPSRHRGGPREVAEHHG